MKEKRSNRQSLSITIPAFNEETTIAEVYRQAREEAGRITSDYEIVLVDDGSVDGTGRIMDQLRQEDARHTVVVHHRHNKGFSGAMLSCYRHASKDLIFLGPADGQFDYREVRSFVPAMKGKDMVVAYRLVNNETWYRKINSFLYHRLARKLFAIKLREMSSCIMYRKAVRDSVRITADPFSCLFLLELIYKARGKGYRIGEVPIHFYARRDGVQKGTNVRMMIKTTIEMMRFWFTTRQRRLSAI